MAHNPIRDLVKICSVLPALLIIPAMAEDVNVVTNRMIIAGGDDYIINNGIKITNIAVDQGGALKVEGTVNAKGSVSFDGNHAVGFATGRGGHGGALGVYGNGLFEYDDASGDIAFKDNKAFGGGGAMYINGSDAKASITANSVLFTGNESGFAFPDGFSQIAQAYGGAVYSDGSLKIDGKTIIFKNNRDNGDYVAAKFHQAGGGALHGRRGDITVGNVNGANAFESNYAVQNGGAIVNRNTSEMVINGTTMFINNTADKGHGGAIYNYGQFDDGIAKESPTLTFNGDVTFDGNMAAKNGGAIWNGTDGTAGVTAKMVFNGDATFTNNSAANGGAIYNGVSAYNGEFIEMTVEDGDFQNNTATANGGAIANYFAALTLNNATIHDNEAGYMGGGLYSQGGKIIIKNSEISDNHAKYFGGVGSGAITEISDTVFERNVATEVGGAGLFTGATLKNVTFRGNHATSTSKTSDGSGALFLGATSRTILDKVLFDSNKSENVGGAISTRSADIGNNKDARLDIINSTFNNNIAATTGGALNNYLYSSAADDTAVYIQNSDFNSNSAANGGAIYNHGEADRGGNVASMLIKDSKFVGNSATEAGGAIFNASGMTLSGRNVFTRNTASGAVNDIHNIGTINIRDGKTVLGGGISGDGVLTVGAGAEMSIGTTTVQQGTLNLDGTIYASVYNDTAYGRLVADQINVGEKGRLVLSTDRVGTYKIFNQDTDIKIDAGFLYSVQNNGAAGIVISQRSVDDIAANTGLSVQASAMAVAISGDTNRRFTSEYRQMLTALRETESSLYPSEIEYYNDQAARAHPYDKPVMHSMATSLQNQIASLTAGRMAGGRAGGDMSVGYGAWVQGMHNKSKYSDKFDASSGGIAFGIDALINRVYTIGIGYANSSSEINAHNRDIDVEAHNLFAYAQYKPGKWFANAMLSYSKADYEEETRLFGQPLAAQYDVDSYGAQIMTGYDFSTGITPELGVRYLHMSQEDYSNSLMHFSGADSDFASAVAGLRYAFDIQSDTKFRWAPELKAAATYDFLSDDVYSTVVLPGIANYRVRGDRLSRMGGEFGIGISARYQGLRVSLNYELDLHQNYTSHSGLLKIKYNF